MRKRYFGTTNKTTGEPVGGVDNYKFYSLQGFGDQPDIFEPRSKRLKLPLEVELEIAGVLWTYVLAGVSLQKELVLKTILETCTYYIHVFNFS